MKNNQWFKVRINREEKIVTLTKQTFDDRDKGEKSLGESGRFIIVCEEGLENMRKDGWKIVDTKFTNNITKAETVKEIWQPQYLVGGAIEEEIRSYTVAKLQRKGVHFVKGLNSINEKSKVSAVEVFGATKHIPVQPLTFHKAYDRFESTMIGRERKAQMMEERV